MEGKLNFKNSRMYVGIAWNQGGRPYMQDAFSLILNYEKDPCTDFLGVFDGHGPNGGPIARYVALNLFNVVMKKYLDQKQQLQEAIQAGFSELDESMRTESSLMKSSGTAVLGGTTALCIWVRHGIMYIAHVGDTRMVMSKKGVAYQVTEDHKPSNNKEFQRIRNARGFVCNDRVLGVLGVARAFADYKYKANEDLPADEQLITACPDLTMVGDENVDFIVLASDGVWDLMTNQEVVNFIRQRMEELSPLQNICADLLKKCKLPIYTLTGIGQDNMTIIIGIFKDKN